MRIVPPASDVNDTGFGLRGRLPAAGKPRFVLSAVARTDPADMARIAHYRFERDRELAIVERIEHQGEQHFDDKFDPPRNITVDVREGHVRMAQMMEHMAKVYEGSMVPLTSEVLDDHRKL